MNYSTSGPASSAPSRASSCMPWAVGCSAAALTLLALVHALPATDLHATHTLPEVGARVATPVWPSAVLSGRSAAAAAREPTLARAAHGSMPYPEAARAAAPIQPMLPVHSGGLLVAVVAAAAAAGALVQRLVGRVPPVSIAMAAESGKFDSVEKKASYGVGLQIGAELWSGGGTFEGIDMEAMQEGLKDGYTKGELQVPVDDLQAAFEAVQAKQKALADEQKMDGVNFLEENDKRPEVTTTESGLQYEVIEKGSGATPLPENTVKVHYTGKLIDGTVFDSSIERGQPAEFPVNRVIKGWTEALLLMEVGAKYKLYIPSDLGYGDKGVGDKIGPYQVLIFDVELIDIVG